LHPGHLRHLAKAKELVDVLVVSITADKFVNKGPGRPAFNENLRAEALANLVSVDFVLITPYPTAIETIELIKPNFYIKGNDYVQEKKDLTGNITLEKNAVESFGGKLVNTDEIIFSSSELINKFLPNHSDEVIEWLNNIKRNYSIDEVLSWLNQISELKVTLIGESIIDVYTDCEALGKSSKDPVLCFNKNSSKSYAGGVLAIGAHCNGLGAKTTIVTGMREHDLKLPMIEDLRKKGIDITSLDTAPAPTIRKERFVDSRTSTRVLELYEMDDTPLSTELDNNFIKLVKQNIDNADVVIVADYGHGLISDNTIKCISDSNKFVAINTQANAGNRGFNSISRYPRANFITLNGGEAQLEVRRRHFEISSFIAELHQKTGAKQILVTKGSEGVEIYSQNKVLQKAPALAPFVKDRVGAGDALLSITSLLTSIGAPEDIIALYGNIVGAWAVSFIGNEKSLDKGSVSRQITSILK
jgi:cytidyltransferase-like protein